ncbi:MAG: methyltransferase domain-containing protein [Phormidesmis sp. CAN_BIN36]|nr:methyltransferase domain-containing protein [Phormidesmis sp. CAN_BIN36]
MIEANNPDINVDELMQKIQDEVARRSSQPLQPITAAASPSVLTVTRSSEHIEALLRNAYSRSIVRTTLPNKFSRFPMSLGKVQDFILKAFNLVFRDQREVNLSLIQALRESVALNQQLTTKLSALQAEVNTLKLSTAVSSQYLETIESYSDEVKTRVDRCLDEVNEQSSQVNLCLDRLAQLHFKDIRYRKDELAQQRDITAHSVEERQEDLLEASHHHLSHYHPAEEDHLLDAFYVAFENRFRGSREQILDLLSVYLPLIADLKLDVPNCQILDIGCGRGEWLELLQKSGYTAKGIDINRVMLDQCRSQGLDVVEADVIGYLRSLPDNYLSVVTGFHIIEHLAFPVLMTLFSETMRVLKPGGIVIFETPNPENVIVGTQSFYIDPTHRNPLPSHTTQFIAESMGFSNVSVMKLHDYPQQQRLVGSDLAERFSDYFYGAQDYAVIGYKS